jgi:hypothetical protein
LTPRTTHLGGLAQTHRSPSNPNLILTHLTHQLHQRQPPPPRCPGGGGSNTPLDASTEDHGGGSPPTLRATQAHSSLAGASTAAQTRGAVASSGTVGAGGSAAGILAGGSATGVLAGGCTAGGGRGDEVTCGDTVYRRAREKLWPAAAAGRRSRGRGRMLRRPVFEDLWLGQRGDLRWPVYRRANRRSSGEQRRPREDLRGPLC